MTETTPRIEALINVIAAIPPWTAGRYDEVKTRALREAATQLASASLEELRGAVETYAQRHRLSDDATEKLSRLYLLLRVVFDVPCSIARQQAKVFGGWNHPSVGSDDPSFRLSWPIEVDQDGRLAVVGVYRSYRGRPYDAAGEFQYFAENFELRTTAQPR
jgi:hypothetical protein